MENNIINIYIKLVKSRLLDFFKIVQKNKYQKGLIEPFIDKYIEVRYYDETNYDKEKDFVVRLNKELLDVYNENCNDNNSDNLKTVVALFGYLIFLDDINNEKNINVIKMLSEDKKTRIELSDNLFEEVKTWYTSFKNSKLKFNEAIATKNFELTKKSVYRKTYEITLNQKVKIPNLYSEYAINKSYNSGIINEDKLFIEYILTSYEVLNEAINFDYSNKYIVELANTLYDKEKKIIRLLNILNSPLTKKQISIKINYSDYVKNKDLINSKIKEGYSFALVIDEKDIEINELILFSYVYVFENSEIFDIINKSKENIGAKIIKCRR